MCTGPSVSPNVRTLYFDIPGAPYSFLLFISKINLQFNKSGTESIELPLENPFPQLTNGFLGKQIVEPGPVKIA